LIIISIPQRFALERFESPALKEKLAQRLAAASTASPAAATGQNKKKNDDDGLYFFSFFFFKNPFFFIQTSPKGAWRWPLGSAKKYLKTVWFLGKS